MNYKKLYKKFRKKENELNKIKARLLSEAHTERNRLDSIIKEFDEEPKKEVKKELRNFQSPLKTIEAKRDNHKFKDDSFICVKCLKVLNYNERQMHYKKYKTHRPVISFSALKGTYGNRIKTRVKMDVKRKYGDERLQDVIDIFEGKRKDKRKKTRDEQLQYKKDYYKKTKYEERFCLQCSKFLDGHNAMTEHQRDEGHKPVVMVKSLKNPSNKFIGQTLNRNNITLHHAQDILKRAEKKRQELRDELKRPEGFVTKKEKIDGYGHLCVQCETWFPTRGAIDFHQSKTAHKPRIEVKGYLEGNKMTSAAIERNNYTKEEVDMVVNRVMKSKDLSRK